MLRPEVINEIAATRNLRIQKVYGLYHVILVFELYSPALKGLFLVFDQNPSTKSVHLQKNRPKGQKTSSKLTALLNKYGVGKVMEFYSAENSDAWLKAILHSHDDKSFSLLFNLLKLRVDLYRDHELIASSIAASPVVSPEIAWQKQGDDLGLLHNFQQGIWHEEALSAHQHQALFNEQIASFKQAMAKKEKLLANILGDLDKCQRALAKQSDAELLQANFLQLKRGMSEIEVLDYYQDPPKNRKILLDPKLGPKEALDTIFKQIKKAKRGMAIIQGRVEEIRAELKNDRARLEELAAKGPKAYAVFPEGKVAPKPSQKANATRKPYKTFLSSDDVKILVGRSARESDELSLHHARGNEWWFHARDTPGAHVVVKSSLDSLPAATLIEAAMLAAHFSKSKLDPHPTIQYTRAKFVKKPKGVAPGLVLVSQEKTLALRTNPEALKALLARVED